MYTVCRRHRSDPSCGAYTWHDKTCGGYAFDCYFIVEPLGGCPPWSKVRTDPGHYTGICNHGKGATSATGNPAARSSPPTPTSSGATAAQGAADGWRAEVPRPTAAATGSTLFVDSVHGDDTGSGTEAAPLRTIAAAVTKVAGLTPPRSILLQGDAPHIISETIRLGAEHSHTTIAPASSQSGAASTVFSNTETIVSGGIKLKGLVWSKDGVATAKGAQVYKASLPTTTPEFLELFLVDGNCPNENSNCGEQSRLVPAREPDGNPELDHSNYDGQALWNKLGPFGNETVPNREFLTNLTLVTNRTSSDPALNKTLDRGGLFPFYEMGMHGPADNFFPPRSFWVTPMGQRAGGGSLYSVPSGMVVGPDGSANASSLSPPGGGFVFMMQTHAWGSWVFEINSTSRNATGFTHVAFGAGGNQEARGNGGGGGGSFYISHRRELLDASGEWYHDSVTQTLYIATAVDDGPPPSSNLVAPVVPTLFAVEGSAGAPATGIRLSSLTFRHAAPTFMANYTVPSGGDYSAHRGGAVTLIGTENVTVDHCLFDGVGGNGIAVIDHNRGALVSANEMRHIGENGVVLMGSTDWVDGRAGTQPRHNTISGNLIHHLGLYTKQSCAIFNAVACQNTISQNILFHGPRALLNINDGFGGDTLVKQNLFFASVLETGDHGPFNCW